MQKINNSNNKDAELFTFIESTYETEEQLAEIMYNEKRNSQVFDLAQGLVTRCLLVHYRQPSADGLLHGPAAIIFNFHHALFDYSSMDLFLTDLNQAYATNQLPIDDDATLRYLDCEYSFLLNSYLCPPHCRRCDRT